MTIQKKCTTINDVFYASQVLRFQNRMEYLDNNKPCTYKLLPEMIIIIEMLSVMWKTIVFCIRNTITLSIGNTRLLLLLPIY